MAPTDLVLRPAERSDGDAIAAIHLRSRRQAAMPPGIHDDDSVRAWLTGRVGEDAVWIADVGDRPVAYARFADSWLDDLYVLPEHAGDGVGSALLDLVKSQRPDGFCLWVFEINRPAREFYARHGLVELERTDGSGNEEREPDVRMAWPGRDPLAFYRRLIDEADRELGDVLNRRSALTRAVQPHKPTAERDPARERAIAEAMAVRAPTLGADRLARIVDVVITESLDAAGE
ncbi:GNAT family N-acetyltransferase [Nocardioides sp.]|uniref:GNAT family N-acetyltransferase n=1 Tax=Nocardioides sp. TaxID=35761 RepID=UPI00356542AB